MATGGLLKMFTIKIAECGSDSADNESEEESASKSDGEEGKTDKTDKTDNKAVDKYTMACNAMEKTAADCDDILVFLQAVVAKAPWVAAAPLMLRADKHARAWFWCWLVHHTAPLSTPLIVAPQYYSGLTEVLSDVAMCIKNAESF